MFGALFRMCCVNLCKKSWSNEQHTEEEKKHSHTQRKIRMKENQIGIGARSLIIFVHFAISCTFTHTYIENEQRVRERKSKALTQFPHLPLHFPYFPFLHSICSWILHFITFPHTFPMNIFSLSISLSLCVCLVFALTTFISLLLFSDFLFGNEKRFLSEVF